MTAKTPVPPPRPSRPVPRAHPASSGPAARAAASPGPSGDSPPPSPPNSFPDLCRAFCARLGVDCPPLQPAGAPVPGLRLAIGGIEVELLQAAGHDAQWALLLVHLGDLPESQEAQAYLTLLQSNFMLMGPSSAVFAVHPVTGSVVLYQSFPVASVNGVRLEQTARELVTIAARWQRGEFLPPAASRGGHAQASRPAHPSDIA